MGAVGGSCGGLGGVLGGSWGLLGCSLGGLGEHFGTKMESKIVKMELRGAPGSIQRPFLTFFSGKVSRQRFFAELSMIFCGSSLTRTLIIHRQGRCIRHFSDFQKARQKNTETMSETQRKSSEFHKKSGPGRFRKSIIQKFSRNSATSGALRRQRAEKGSKRAVWGPKRGAKGGLGQKQFVTWWSSAVSRRPAEV